MKKMDTTPTTEKNLVDEEKGLDNSSKQKDTRNLYKFYSENKFQPLGKEIPALSSDDNDESEDEETSVKMMEQKPSHNKSREAQKSKQEPNLLVKNVLKLSKLINIRHMSKKDFKTRCLNLRKKCTNVKISGEECDHHTSLKNLQKTSNNMKIILRQSSNVTDDWKSYKRLKLGKYGYVAITINFPEISTELSRLKSLIKKFNTSRRNILKFKDVIRDYRKTQVNYMNLQLGSHPILAERKRETKIRLEKKSPPYATAELKEISLQAFTSEYI